MRFFHVVLAALVLSVTVPAIASAETYSHPEAKVEFTAPSGWATETEDDVLFVGPKDESVSLMFLVLDAKDLDTATEAIDETLSEEFTNIKSDDEAVPITINGMEGVAVGATGKAEGQSVELAVLILFTKSGKYLMIVGSADAGSLSKHKKKIDKLVMSIKPV